MGEVKTMPTLVLDTNVILQDPTILARGGGDLKIVIPAPVLEQLDRYRGRDVHPRLTELIRRAHDEKKIEIRNAKTDYGAIFLGLDPTDASILNLAKEIPDSVLVTRDVRLLNAAAKIDVRASTLEAARHYLQTPDAKLLSEAKKAIGWRRFFFIVGQIVALAVAFGLISFLASIKEIRGAIGFGGIFIVIAVFAFGLYAFRSWFRFSYGAAEAFFGFIAVWYSLKGDLIAEGAHSLDALKLGASLYIVIRGLDNMQRGLKGSSYEDWLNNLLPP